MSDTPKKNEPKHNGPVTPPAKASTDNFKLDLSDGMLATGAVRKPGRADPYPTGSFQPKKEYLTEKERKQAEKEHRKRNRIKAGKNKWVFRIVWLVMVLLISFTCATYLLDGAFDFLGTKRPESIAQVNIPENVTQEQLVDILYSSGTIKRRDFFDIYVTLTAQERLEDIQSGQHEVSTNLDYEGLLNTLMGGESDRTVITLVFPEGTNALGIAEILAENGFGTKEEALAAMQLTEFSNYSMVTDITDVDQRPYPLEGYLFPDTYNFYDTDDYETIYGKMLDNTRSKLSVIRSKIEESGMTLDEVLTLASIIQREAADRTDMYKVSAVLNNRMKFGAQYDIFRLECDATMYYPYRTPEEAGPDYNTTRQSPYNTYMVEGLPVGPICNPGVDAIYAALSPSEEQAQALYFCHDEDGNAYYADNVWEHEQNLVLAGLVDY